MLTRAGNKWFATNVSECSRNAFEVVFIYSFSGISDTSVNS